jgi:hypothetical protein
MRFEFATQILMTVCFVPGAVNVSILDEHSLQFPFSPFFRFVRVSTDEGLTAHGCERESFTYRLLVQPGETTRKV